MGREEWLSLCLDYNTILLQDTLEFKNSKLWKKKAFSAVSISHGSCESPVTHFHSHPTHISPQLFSRDIMLGFLLLHMYSRDMLWETRFKYGALPCAFRLILHLLPLRLNATTKKTPDHLMMQAVLMLIYFASGTKMSHRSISGSVAAEGRLCRVGPCTDMGALRISLHTSDPCSKLLKSGRLNLH